MILYPDIRPYNKFCLKRDALHEIAIEESGNRFGIPIIVLHGGPGGACSPLHRRFFNPEKYRIILFDQRGSGKSLPYGELRANNTQALIEDIEVIRKHLKIDKYLLFGGSWGATLGLLYAQKYPQHVLAMVLRGVFLARKQDLDWLYKEGANKFFPDAWTDFIKPISKNERDDLIAAYYRRLTGTDDLMRLAAARTWAVWEAHCSTLRPSHSIIDQYMDARNAICLARIESHYFMNDCFINENQILDNMHRLENIPAVIVHGRYDMVCPLESAYSLHQHWQGSELHVIRDAGHASTEHGIVDALVRACDDFAERFSHK